MNITIPVAMRPIRLSCSWLTCLFIGLAFGSSIAAQAQPWPRLPDDRVVIDLKGHRLAFDPTDNFTRVMFYDGRSTYWSLSQVVSDPNGARGFFANMTAVTITMANSTNVKGLFLGRYDRRTIPQSTRIEMTVGNAFRGAYCDLYPSAPKCGFLDPETERGATIDPDGLIKFGPSFYLVPPSRSRSSAVDPIEFLCSTSIEDSNTFLQDCHTRYMLRPYAQIYYEFRRNQVPKSEWIEMDRRLRLMFADLFVPE